MPDPARRLSLAIAYLLAFCAGAGAQSVPRDPSDHGAAMPGSAVAGAQIIASGAPVPTALFRMYVRNAVDALGLDRATDEGRRKIAMVEQEVLSELIDRSLIEAEVQRRGIGPSEREIAERRATWIERIGGDSRYRSYLAEHHLRGADFDRMVVQELAAERLCAELTRGVRVSEDEIRDFYENHGRREPADESFRAPEQVAASHILISARPQLIERRFHAERDLDGDALAAAVRAEMEARRQRAERVRREAAAGRDFGALAREWSDDPASRVRGGDLGVFGRNTHVRAFDEAAFALPVGAVSDVVETEYGFHIIKVTGRTAARVRSLDELRPAIHERLLARKRIERLRGWLAAERTRGGSGAISTLRDVEEGPRRDTAAPVAGATADFRRTP